MMINFTHTTVTHDKNKIKNKKVLATHSQVTLLPLGMDPGVVYIDYSDMHCNAVLYCIYYATVM